MHEVVSVVLEESWKMNRYHDENHLKSYSLQKLRRRLT
jgi:hypothetical protein